MPILFYYLKFNFMLIRRFQINKTIMLIKSKNRKIVIGLYKYIGDDKNT